MGNRYHHGDLREDLLRRAVALITREGPSELSLRSLARDAGVSHAAPRHHFGTRTGLLTAVAAEGFSVLANRLHAAGAEGAFLDVGVAYVEFAVQHPAHFDVMFRPDLLDPSDADLIRHQQEAFGILRSGVEAMAERGAVSDAAAAVVAGWSLVHGLATLAASGSLDTARLRELLDEPDLADVARRAAGMLYGSPGRP
jgi:AcrR family transcriptional regulator